nr:ATP-binding cassette domain-containing protein [Rickettsia felis]
MIIINDLAMSYGARILFTDVSLHIKNNKRYGLVGANGAGKTTFFQSFN